MYVLHNSNHAKYMHAQNKEDIRKDEDFIKGANISNLNEDETISSIDVSSSELRNNDNSGDI